MVNGPWQPWESMDGAAWGAPARHVAPSSDSPTLGHNAGRASPSPLVVHATDLRVAVLAWPLRLLHMIRAHAQGHRSRSRKPRRSRLNCDDEREAAYGGPIP